MSELNAQQKNIIGLYALLGAGSIMMLILYGFIPLIGIICTFVVLFGAYFYKWRYRADETLKGNVAYLIRTIWWSQLILTVAVIIFGCVVYNNGDRTAIDALMLNAQNGVVPNEQDIAQMQLRFVVDNQSLIKIAGIICLSPFPLYLLYRTIKGVKAVVK